MHEDAALLPHQRMHARANGVVTTRAKFATNVEKQPEPKGWIVEATNVLKICKKVDDEVRLKYTDAQRKKWIGGLPVLVVRFAVLVPRY